MMEVMFHSVMGILKDPINIVLTTMVFLLIIALVWTTRCFTREREYNRKNAEELMNNTIVLRELASMIKLLVMGRRNLNEDP